MAVRQRQRRKAVKAKPRRPAASREKEAPHVPSPTAVAAEALRTGVPPKRMPRHRDEIPRDEKMRMGDPDDSVLQNEYSGEETPGGSTPTPDQNGVDEIGRAYGLQEEDSGSLRSGAEVLDRRDRHRHELLPPRRPSP